MTSHSAPLAQPPRTLANARRKTKIFLIAAILVMSMAPLVNIAQWLARPEPKAPLGSLAFYNLDWAQAGLDHLLVPLGISTDPSEVVVGKHGWLFLGDKPAYGKPLSTKRKTAVWLERYIADNTIKSSQGLADWLRSHGVSYFRIAVAPDKESIYPQFLPNWVRPVAYNGVDALFSAAPPSVYMDLRPAVRAARDASALPLYYKTDTHWNALGAWAGFQELGRVMKQELPGLKWPASDAAVQTAVAAGRSGDLARFLRVGETLSEQDPVMELRPEYQVQTRAIDFATGAVAYEGGNPPVAAPLKPLQVDSKGALNDKRVLWIRDSFGSAMAPFMAATFTHTVQVSRAVTKQEFEDVMARFKPEYVLITNVERDAKNDWLRFPLP
jgi:hypothetical protein